MNNSVQIRESEGVRGFCSIAAVIASLYSDSYPKKAEVKKLVLELFQLAHEKKITKVGEIFRVSDVIKVFDQYNKKYKKMIVKHKVISYNSVAELKESISSNLKGDHYILFPYNAAYKNKKNKIQVNWYTLSSINNNQVTLLNGKNSETTCLVEDLFLSNQSITGMFSWKDYYKKMSNPLHYVNQLMAFIYDRNMFKRLKTIESIKNVEILKNQPTIAYDLASKLVVVNK